MDVRAEIERARGRLALPVLGRVAQSALAAGAAWEIALQIPDHGQPFFAPIAAVIGLGAERGRRGRQAIQMMTGVALGILIGAAVVAVAGVGAWQIVLGTAVALLVPTAFGTPPIIRIQSAASAILVVALHRPGGGNLAIQRLVDALIGGGIAVLLARVLFPIDPLELVRGQAREVRTRLGDALEALADALARRDRGRAVEAQRRLDAIDDRRLEEALSLAREVARAAPRRRPLRRRVEALGIVYRELDASVADARAIAAGTLRLLAQPSPPEAAAVDAVRAAVEAVRTVDAEASREAATAAAAAASRLRESDTSLGASVLAHGVAAVADHTRAAADARDEDTRLAAGARIRRPWRRVQRSRGP